MTVVSLGKRIIPDPVKPHMARLYHATRLGGRATITSCRNWLIDSLLLSHAAGRFLLYRVFSNGFSAEYRAVAAGRFVYLKERKSSQRSLYLLRRNIHRIEKGLVSENPRAVFAVEYIEETVAEFAAQSNASGTTPDDQEYLWARNVLMTYFLRVRPSEKRVRNAHEMFAQLCLETPASASSNIPFLRDLKSNPVAIKDLKDLSIKRRSVRAYLPKPVPRALVDNAIDVARFSPSACNRQAFTFRIFDTPETAQKVASLPMGTASFIDKISAVVVVLGHLRAYPFARDRHAVYVDASMAAMSFINGLEAQGVASCVINWADEPKRERAAAKLLGLQPDERVLMMISYGWPKPDVPVPYSAKRPIEDMRIFEVSI